MVHISCKFAFLTLARKAGWRGRQGSRVVMCVIFGGGWGVVVEEDEDEDGL